MLFMLKRFLISYVLLCVLPFLILGIVLASITEETISAELINAAQVSLDESVHAVSNLVAEARQLSLSVANDSQIQSALRAFRYADDIKQRTICLQNLNEAMSQHQSYGTSSMRARLAVVSENQNEIELNLSRVEIVLPNNDQSWYTLASQYPKQFHWKLFIDENSVYLRQSKAIYDTTTWQPVNAYVLIDINSERLRAISISKGASSGRIYLVAGDGVIIYPYYNYDHIPSEVLKATTNGTFKNEEKRFLIQRMPDTGWNLIRVISVSDIDAQTSRIKITIFTTACLFMLLSCIATIYFTTRIFNPISRLADKMKHIRAGKLTPIDNKHSSGEIGALYESYNYMIDRLNFQIKRTYISQINEKDAQLRALQAQINPHFLYNTLDSINWMALRYHANDISIMIVSLSDMLRFSLNKGRDTLLVQDELRQVDAYITLQRVRYSNRFRVEYKVADAVRHKRIIKMLLQPIVENAIIHGFELIEEGGLIYISIYVQDRLLHFEVCNNGTPINLERMHKRLSGDDDEPQRGYGIRNVNERIKAYYGIQYGIEYEIRNGMTVAHFSIPEEENFNAQSNDC